MRRLLLALTAPLMVLAGAPAAHAASTLVVPIDHSAAVSLPRGTRDVLIGNPAIADVSHFPGALTALAENIQEGADIEIMRAALAEIGEPEPALPVEDEIVGPLELPFAAVGEQRLDLAV